MRVPVAVLGWIAASAMCCRRVVASPTTSGRSRASRLPRRSQRPEDLNKDCDVYFAQKFEVVTRGVSSDFFLMGRQISLDLKSIPHVLVGHEVRRLDEKSGEWNAWLKGSGNPAAHFKQDAVNNLAHAGGSSPRRGPHPRGQCAPGEMERARRGSSFVTSTSVPSPFGLLMIALRFVLRSLLAISGHVRVDPDAVHEEEEVEEKHPELRPAHAPGAKGNA